MKTRLEREAKLEAADSFELPGQLPDGFVLGPSREEKMQTAYYDTADLRLAKHDISLRRRKGEGWTLKLPEAAHGQALFRQEHVFAGDTGVIPDEALDLVQAIVRREPLSCVARLVTLRRHVPVLDPAGRSLGEIVDDAVSVVQNGRATPRFREVEIELAEDAPDEVLDTLVEVLVEQGAIAASPRSKLVRALGARASEIAPSEPPDLAHEPSIAAFIRAILASSIRNLVRNDPGVRLGGDPEHVHQARVATRRLRSNLRTFEAFLDERWVRNLRVELKWLGAALGAVRDTDVLLERLTRRADQLAEQERPDARALLSRLEADRHGKRSELLIMLRSDRYIDVLEALDGATLQPPIRETASTQSVDGLVGLVKQPWRKLKRAGRSCANKATDAELHAVRIRAKRCRYAAEAVAPLRGATAREFALACQQVQDVLGEHQDCVVAQEWLRTNAFASSSREAFAAGQLALLEQQAASAARSAWPSAWRRLDRKKLRHWLRH